MLDDTTNGITKYTPFDPRKRRLFFYQWYRYDAGDTHSLRTWLESTDADPWLYKFYRLDLLTDGDDKVFKANCRIITEYKPQGEVVPPKTTQEVDIPISDDTSDIIIIRGEAFNSLQKHIKTEWDFDLDIIRTENEADIIKIKSGGKV